jgi:hypothetical protein
MELKELLNKFNAMITLSKDIHGIDNGKCIEVCNVQSNLISSLDKCTTKFQIYKGLIELWTSILCPKHALAKWHSR